MTKEEFDAAVKALRGKVAPKKANKKKADSTPEEWAANADYMIKWQSENRDKTREYVRRWSAANPERIKELGQQWRKANPGLSTKWKRANADKSRDYARNYQATRKNNDPTFKLLAILRDRLNVAIRRNAKKGSAVRDLGCSVDELWAHLESKFQPGMTRENMGKAWEIDHIFPLSKANLKESRVEFLAANNWRNLQPLTPKQNREKGGTVTPEAQALFDQLKAEFAGT
jgi:hypothetical protein